MKRCILCVIAMAACAFPTPSLAEKGVVVAICGNNYLVSANSGYSLLEWYGGAELSKGQTVGGEINRYGMHDIYNLNNGREIRVWVDDWGLSSDRAIEKWREKCE